MSRNSVGLLGALVVALVLHATLPLGDGERVFLYDAIASAALIVAWLALWRRKPALRRAWVLVLAGFSTWVLGDVVWSVEQYVVKLETYPGFSDACYLSGYGFLIGGALVLVRARGGGQRDLANLLDAVIVAAGAAVPAVVFVIEPIATDSSLSLLGKFVVSAYPFGDVLLIAMLVRLVSSPGSRSDAFVLLVAAMGMTLAADLSWNVTTVLTSSDLATWWMESLWLASYIFLAAALMHPSARTLAEAPDLAALPSRWRLVLLALGLLLPALTLVGTGISAEQVPWATIALGGAALTVLVLARMDGLLEQIRDQADLLAELARSDGLTGIANRRTWDFELARACASAEDSGAPLCVVLLDLDRFKDYNDTHGHQAGDHLLKQAANAWAAVLGPNDLLARYGGEEFTALLPHTDLAAATERAEALRRATPEGQTVSAGVAQWHPGTDPVTVTADADHGLYEAKRTGRNRVVVSTSQPSS